MELIVTSDGIGRMDGDRILLLSTDFSNLSEPLLRGQDLEGLGALEVRAEIAYGDAKILTPMGRGMTIWGVGSNYPRNGVAPKRQSGLPTFFMKAPNSFADPGADLRAPGAIAAEFDYEGEVAVVIGRPTFDIEESQAWSHVAAITAANDSTARDVMTATGNPVVAKSFPEIGGIGPTVVPLSAVADRENITVKSWVNGELRQDSSTSHLIYSIPELVSLVSRFVRLAPGDVLLTGGPEGRGADSGRFLVDGDVVSVSVAGLRPLTNTVRSRSGTHTLQDLVKEK